MYGQNGKKFQLMHLEFYSEIYEVYLQKQITQVFFKFSKIMFFIMLSCFYCYLASIFFIFYLIKITQLQFD